MGGVCAFSIHNRLFHQLDNNSCLFTEQAVYDPQVGAQEFPFLTFLHFHRHQVLQYGFAGILVNILELIIFKMRTDRFILVVNNICNDQVIAECH